MSKFVKDSDLQQIDLGDGEWVKLPKRLSYKMVSKFQDAEGNDAEKTANLLMSVIREWNLIDPDTGTVAPITREYIDILEVGVVKAIVESIAPMLTIEKKSS